MAIIKRSAVVPYSAAEMYSLVDAIQDYPQFVPWCHTSKVHSRTEDEVRASLCFARGGLQKSFTTCNRLQKDKMIEERTIIQSFDIRTLHYLHTNYPQIKTALLVEGAGSLQENISKLGFTPSIYSPDFTLVNPLLVKQCKEMKMKIIPWTVNDKPSIDKLKNMGVDGIISDYPNLF